MCEESTPAFMDLAFRDRAPGIAIVTTVGCPHCKRAKDTLKKARLAFDEIELSRDLQLLRAIKSATKQSTVPQVRLLFSTVAWGAQSPKYPAQTGCVISCRCSWEGR
jgi:glutaredoxin